MLLNTARNGAIALPSVELIPGAGSAAALSLRELASEISDPNNLDATVEEVFGTALGVQCRRQEHARTSELIREAGSITAVIGFAGLLTGACLFRCGAETAASIVSLMTGMHFGEVDQTVKDGVGEICNMLAGVWKRKVPQLAAHCGLSVPAVITGRHYELSVHAPEFELRHAYGFRNASFTVTIVCDGLH